MRVISPRRPNRRPGLLPTENRKLRSENKQFDVLGEGAAAVPDQQSQQCRKPEVGEGEERPPLLPEPGPSPPIEATRGFKLLPAAHRTRGDTGRSGARLIEPSRSSTLKASVSISP